MHSVWCKCLIALHQYNKMHLNMYKTLLYKSGEYEWMMEDESTKGGVRPWLKSSTTSP